MALMFNQGHRVTEYLELMQSFCWQVARSNSNVHDCWLCKIDDCEEALYGEYRSFGLVLFLFISVLGCKTYDVFVRHIQTDVSRD